MQRFKNLKPEHLLSFAFVACALRVLYKICMIYRNSHKSFFLFSSRNLIVSSITFGSLIYLEFFIYWNAFLSHSWRPSKHTFCSPSNCLVWRHGVCKCSNDCDVTGHIRWVWITESRIQFLCSILTKTWLLSMTLKYCRKMGW